jgi:hypothetical protein
MASTPYPTGREIRSALIERLRAFSDVTGIAPSVVCRTVMNDTNFYSKLVGGGNFTIETYQRFHAHFDQSWPRTAKPKRSAAAKPKSPTKHKRSAATKPKRKGVKRAKRNGNGAA